MKAGRELDTLIAKKVMRITWAIEEVFDNEVRIYIRQPDYDLMPRYSTDISAAKCVIYEMVINRGYAFRLDIGWEEPLLAEAFFWEPTVGMHDKPFKAKGMIEVAICLAALKAVGVDV